MGKSPRERRREKRVHAKYLVHTNQTQRRDLSEEEIKTFFEEIYRKNFSFFGIVKCSQVNLDAIHDLPKLPRPMTFMEYASHLNRDFIVAKLLQAGANPVCLRNLSDEEKLAQTYVIQYLISIPEQYAVWIAKTISSFREHSEEGICPQCELERTLLSFMPCGHQFCESCLWKATCTSYHTLRCLICSNLSSGDNGLEPIRNFQSRTPEQIKQLSLSKFKDVPLEAKYKKPKKSRFKALPLCIIDRKVALTKRDRMHDLHKCCESGNLYRLSALVDAGVDLDHQNQYGQTACFIASWRGHFEVVQFLLECGSDPNIISAGGASPLDIALKSNSDIADLLEKVGGRSGSMVDLEQHCCLLDSSCIKCITLMDRSETHPGAGSYYIDDCFTEDFLDHLDNLWQNLPCAPREKDSPNDRSYFCDSLGLVTSPIEQVLNTLEIGLHAQVLPHLRLVSYLRPNTSLPPHVDLARTDHEGRNSTHTLILYLRDCNEGGETVLVRKINDPIHLKTVAPKRGRILFFPHNCPHKGDVVVSAPKVFLRGEIYLEYT